jgi:lipopolysaccharide export system permease protein
MTYGNLSEHNELTAIKSAGISLVRIIAPVFFVVSGLTVLAFYFNNKIVPIANLRAYSLLYDITTKKAAFNIKEGTFYYGLPGFAVKINQKEPDGTTIKKVMIYNHQDERGNVNLTMADSGKMYTIWNDRYLILELFNGDNFSEVLPKNPDQESEFTQNHFGYSKLVFNLSSFEMSRTDIQLFASNKIMRNIPELKRDLDSIKREGENVRNNAFNNFQTYFGYFRRQHVGVKLEDKKADSLFNKLATKWESEAGNIRQSMKNQIMSLKNFSESNSTRLFQNFRDLDVFEVEIFKKYTQSAACLILFLIGAPLGAIIRKGGFGVPVLISIVFFILYYILSITGEKWSKENVVEVPVGMWFTNFALFWVGLYFLSKARADSSLLDNNYIIRFFNWVSGQILNLIFKKIKSPKVDL